MKEVLEFLNKLAEKPVSVAVVGDCVIDEYYQVVANRVSPEFPIPVMLSDNFRPHVSLPGGAANVCRQLRYFNAFLRLYALADEKLKKVLTSYGMSAEYCATMHPDGRVPLKKRVYQNDFPLCRWDVESRNYGLQDVDISDARGRLYEAYKNSKRVDVTIFSDYDKGLFSTEFDWIKAKKCMTVVDPKTGPISKWKGCTVFKPNAKEAEVLSGYRDWKAQADFFAKNLKCQVVITQGGDGVVGKINGEYFEYTPRKSVTAESVIGAGDCFIAFLAAGLPVVGLKRAIPLAWEAGALYVQKKHNSVVTPLRLRTEINPLLGKFVSPEELEDRDFDITFTNGCFDVLHPGHLHLLRYCKSIGNRVVVAVNSDESVEYLKGPGRPVHTLDDRMNMLAALEYVDFVVAFDAETPAELIEQLCPEVLVKGGDYAPEDVVGSDLVPDVRICPLYEGHSTTSILAKTEE
jgi:D-beta-D-heptose 7-phosphate kinase/D-beta-D-heptose 1-phosphate adenosyltransferase